MLYRRTRPRANRTVAAFFSATHGTHQAVEGAEETVQAKVPNSHAAELEEPDVAPEAPAVCGNSANAPEQAEQSRLEIPLSTAGREPTAHPPLATAPAPSSQSPPISAPLDTTITTTKASATLCRAVVGEDSAASFLAQKSRLKKRHTVADRFAAREAPTPPSTSASSSDTCSQVQSSTSPCSNDLGYDGGANQPSLGVTQCVLPATQTHDVPEVTAETNFLGCDGESSLTAESFPSTLDGVLGDSSPENDDVIADSKCDFEIWVETDINPAWCLDIDDNDSGNWRKDCQTASLRRNWDEFEALGQQVIPGITEISVREALELLGLPGDADLAQVQEQAKRAFRQQSRNCHPDKNGGATSDKFQALVAAYQVIQRSVAPGPNA
mmetsp:Transcript_458/g.699  ORF Transcript_458/g.699 Transcript_458/m.699 type:complete len:383 (-) Transcript_458:64-1212(-)